MRVSLSFVAFVAILRSSAFSQAPEPPVVPADEAPSEVESGAEPEGGAAASAEATTEAAPEAPLAEPTPPPAPVAYAATTSGATATEATDAGAPSDAPIGASPIAEGLDAEFGQGITLRSDDGDFSLTIRGRIQARAQLLHTPEDDDSEEDTDIGFLIRRMRLVFLGHLGSPSLQFYIQLGFAPGDLENPPNPIRDAVITWLPTPSFGLRVGQTKVPFNRERVISSSALQLVDRSIVNAELNLDRDIGLQIFHNDVFGLGGRLGFQAGVFGGDGRNRLNEDAGLLYVARVQVQPTGRFDDAYSEADLLRTSTPRLSFGAGFAYNQDTHRRRGTHGSFFQLDEGFDVLHAEVDLAFKWAGFSLLAELLWRRAIDDDVNVGVVDGETIEERFGSALGVMVQAGYLFRGGWEIAARFADIRPTHDASGQPEQRELLGGLGWYILDHNLKLQSDYGVQFAGPFEDLTHQLRVQLQLFY
ncbi:MAG: OprO/OprP family phosphate-selective porin [Myxococcota bacterium]|jgi:hypothetical protein|nr:OprO/OprP family phosphate-selective porin [Myxococcota bacterium]